MTDKNPKLDAILRQIPDTLPSSEAAFEPIDDGLLFAYHEGTLDDQAVADLERRLACDPDARALWRAAVRSGEADAEHNPQIELIVEHFPNRGRTYSVNPSKIAKTVPQLPEIARSGIEL